MVNREDFDPDVYAFYRRALEGQGFEVTFSAGDIPAMREDELRRHLRQTEPYEVAEKTDIRIRREGAEDLPVRIYVPEAVKRSEVPAPVILYFHGGGYVVGSVEDHDPVCGKLADSCESVVVSVEYRLAPEHPFPACIEDAVCAAEWAAHHALDHHGDPAKLLAAGDSSGANISAVLALLGRDGRAPKLSGLLLFYGTYGCVGIGDSESVRKYGGGEYVLPRRSIEAFFRLYAPEGPDPEDYRLNPGRAQDLTGLPPAILVTAELDPLRDDGEEFARRLAAAGCDVESIRMTGMMHGFIVYWQRFRRAEALLEEIGRKVRAWG